jgi:predicted PurR-regulated permease PerM
VAEWLERAFERRRRDHASRAGRRTAAAALTFALLVGLMAPLVAAGLVAYDRILELVGALKTASPLRGALLSALRANASDLDPRVLVTIGGRVLGGSIRFLVQTFVFLVGAFTFLVSGDRACRWAETVAPIPPAHFRRLAAAFRETGRGLVVGLGLTAVVQGTIAGAAYAVLGVPSPVLLGVITALCALLPPIGTALVWGPAAVGLFVSGQVGRSIALVAIGAGIVSTIDNVLRPWLSRVGKLQLPMLALLSSMLGGLTVLGPAGLVLGPLAVRLAREALSILRDEQRL